MPLIQVKLIEGVFDAAEKEAIIEKLTDAMVSVEGEVMRPVTWVVIEEVADGEWGIAGKPHTRATSSHALRCPVAELTTASLQPMQRTSPTRWQCRPSLGVARRSRVWPR